MKVSRLSPLDFEKAAALLGSGLGPKDQVHEYRVEWPLAPTEAISEGATIRAGKDQVWQTLWFDPQPSLYLAFEDLAPQLLDLPFALENVWVHVHEDSLAKQMHRSLYRFRVSAGELTIEIPVTLAKDTPDRDRKATEIAYEVAKGKSAPRGLISKIYVGTELSQDWQKTPTLREYRERHQRRSK